MKATLAPLAAAAIALTATGALAENAVSQSRAKLEREFAKQAASERQVTQSARPSFLGSLFGAEINFGIGDIDRVENGTSFRRFGEGTRAGR